MLRGNKYYDQIANIRRVVKGRSPKKAMLRGSNDEGDKIDKEVEARERRIR